MSNLVLHNLLTDELASTIGPSCFEEDPNEEDDDNCDGGQVTKEDQRIQREKIMQDTKRLETFLDNFDFFTGKS